MYVYILSRVATGRWIICDSGKRKDVSGRTSVYLGLITPLYRYRNGRRFQVMKWEEYTGKLGKVI